VQSPLHPLKGELVAFAVSVTVVPLSNKPVHWLPQLIPFTSEVTVAPLVFGSGTVTLMAGLHPRKLQMVLHSGCVGSFTPAMAILGFGPNGPDGLKLQVTPNKAPE